MIGKVLMYDDWELDHWPVFRLCLVDGLSRVWHLKGRHPMVLVRGPLDDVFSAPGCRTYMVLLRGRVCFLELSNREFESMGARKKKVRT